MNNGVLRLFLTFKKEQLKKEYFIRRMSVISAVGVDEISFVS